MTSVRLTPLLTVIAAAVVVAAATAPAAAAATPEPAKPAVAASSGPTGDDWRLRGDLTAHDPALVKGGNGQDWYVFSTGNAQIGGGAIQIRRSPDGRTWSSAGTVWDKMPDWLVKAVPGVTYLWAPEVHHHDGTYYLYYSASTWGKNNSIIALATNTTLDPTDPAYKWVDQGQVVRSTPQSDFNAIDAGVVEDANGTPWMAFGSYWTGIQMVQLEWPSGKRSADKTRYKLANRQEAPNAIEAAYVVRHDGWYYLFTSWGQCCQGVDSDYKIVVGRARDVTGPYVDKDGRKLLEGGGSLLRKSTGNQVGPGGQSVSEEIIAYHYYDAKAKGAPKLGLKRVGWGDDGWPELDADKK
jgi:arabinan endo-1,5-alpha-L-arabinosidase